jgi:hypothetical protein
MRRGKTRTLGGMRPKLAPHAIAGWLYLVPVALVAGIWFIYLFVAMPENQTAWQSVIGQLRHTFSDANPQAWWFAWMIALPVACAVLALVYLRGALRSRGSRTTLFACAVALGIATFALNDLGLAIFVALPILWGYRAIHAT